MARRMWSRDELIDLLSNLVPVDPPVQHIVTFDSDGGSAVPAQTINKGSKATRPADPTKEGFDFIGWFLGEVEFNFDTAITADITLVAQWAIEQDPDPSIPARYVQTTTANFDANGDYIGTEEYIILPADKTSGYKILNINVKGVATDGDYLTDTSNMFYGNNSLYLELDYLDTSKVTNMSVMFNSSKATTLDLSSFDTSNVTDMSFMFMDSQATELDLSSFDTSSVTNMNYMFNNSKATTLDLSSFDTSQVTNMANMFQLAEATTGYARTQADADKFNNSSGKPSTLTFVVK